MRKLVVLFAVALVASLVVAQAPQGPPKPGPEHKKLDLFIGKATTTADVKASPMGPAGKSTATGTCKWMFDGFHVACDSTEKGPMGERKAHALMSYDTEGKHYNYYEVDNMGGSVFAKGTVSGNVWTWTASGKMGGKMYNYKYTATVTPGGETFKFEMAEGTGPMQVVSEGKTTRVK